MRCEPIVALIVGVVLILLVIWSRRLCRRGKCTSTATKPPRAPREPKPFAGFTHKPECLACKQEAAIQPAASAPTRLHPCGPQLIYLPAVQGILRLRPHGFMAHTALDIRPRSRNNMAENA
jgi:hypothetical protein